MIWTRIQCYGSWCMADFCSVPPSVLLLGLVHVSRRSNISADVSYGYADRKREDWLQLLKKLFSLAVVTLRHSANLLTNRDGDKLSLNNLYTQAEMYVRRSLVSFPS